MDSLCIWIQGSRPSDWNGANWNDENWLYPTVQIRSRLCKVSEDQISREIYTVVRYTFADPQSSLQSKDDWGPDPQSSLQSFRGAYQGSPHVGPSETQDAGCWSAVPDASDCCRLSQPANPRIPRYGGFLENSVAQVCKAFVSLEGYKGVPRNGGRK